MVVIAFNDAQFGRVAAQLRIAATNSSGASDST
jgi:hypothetical protein